MARRKHSYIIEMNSIDDTYSEYVYRYGNVSNIKILISENGVRIELAIGKKYSVSDILGYGKYYIFPDSIKKALITHLLCYSSELKLNVIKVIIDGEEHIIDTQSKNVVVSLINGRLLRPLSNEFSTHETIESILNHTKTTQDSRSAALYAFIISKTKSYEAERFVYLWMAFNGVYGHISRFVKPLKDIKYPNRKNKVADGEGIGYILAINGWTHCRVVENDAAFIARKVIGELKDWDGQPITEDSLKSGIHIELRNNIQNCLKKKDGTVLNISVYGYLLGFFAYYFRCNFIHANKPIPLYSYKGEYEVKCLSIVNQMLESFLDDTLPFFLKERNQETLKQMTQEVFDNPAIDVS